MHATALFSHALGWTLYGTHSLADQCRHSTCCCMSCTKDSIGLPASKRTVLIRRIRPWAAFTVRRTLRTAEVQRYSNGTTRTFGTQGVCWGLKCKLGTSGSAGYASLPTVPVEYTSTEPRGAS